MAALVGYTLLMVTSLVVSWQVTSRFGTGVFIQVLVGVFIAIIYAIVSFRNLTVPLIVLMLSIGGFKFLLEISAPILPDLFLDRMALIWLTGVFAIKLFAERRTLRGPYLLDFFLLANLIYVFFSMYFTDMISFNLWTKSYLTAYATYYFTKNIITSRSAVRWFLGVLLALVAYYSVTSVAEKYALYWLIWPKYIITQEAFAGRSGGPFRHAPLFGTVIGMLLPIHFYFLATTRNVLARVLVYVSFILGMAGLYFTYTRGSWIAGIIAVVVAVVLNRRQYLRMVLPAILLVPVLAIGLLGIRQDRFAQERFENRDTMGSRIGTMVTATQVWRANPVFGVGFYQYRFVIEDFVRPIEVPGLGTIRVAQFRHNPPHDIYFALLAETGLVGVFLQGMIYILVFRAYLTRYRQRREDDEFVDLIMPVLGGICAGYLVGGLAIDYKFFSVVGALFYSCAAIMYGYRPEDFYGLRPTQSPTPVSHSSTPGSVATPAPWPPVE